MPKTFINRTRKLSLIIEPEISFVQNKCKNRFEIQMWAQLKTKSNFRAKNEKERRKHGTLLNFKVSDNAKRALD